MAQKAHQQQQVRWLLLVNFWCIRSAPEGAFREEVSSEKAVQKCFGVVLNQI
jgi:hypothetical protein